MYLLFIAFIVMSAMIDVEHFNKYQYIDDHTSRVFLRGIVILGFSSSLIDVAIFFFMWVTLFDFVINWLWHKPITYIGGRAKIDIFFRQYPKVYMLSKGAAFIFSLLFNICVIKIKHHEFSRQPPLYKRSRMGKPRR